MPLSPPRQRLCPHGRGENGRYCRHCKRSKAYCSHSNLARTCKECSGPGICRHRHVKRFCSKGGPDSSCGKDLCKEHKINKRTCKICKGWAVLAGEMLTSPDFDVAPWQVEEAERLMTLPSKKSRTLDFDAAAD